MSRVRDAAPHHLTQPPGKPPPCVGDRGGPPRAACSRAARACWGAQPRLTFRGRRATQRIRPSANGIGTLFGGPHRQPGFHFDAARGLGRRGDLLPVDRLGRDVLGLFNVAQPGLEFNRARRGFPRARPPSPPVGAAACATPRRRRAHPGPAARVARRLPNGGIGLVERSQSLLGGILTSGLLAQRPGQRRAELAGLRLDCGEFRYAPWRFRR